MKLRSQMNQITKTLAMLWQLDRTVFITGILGAIISSVIPYIEIYLSAYVLDGLAAGIDPKPFFQTVVLILASIFLLNIINSFLNQIRTVHDDLCVKKFDMLMGIRTLSMDYELLDSPQVNKIRTQINTDNQWGAGFFSVIWQFPSLISAILNLIFAIVFLIPLFTSSNIFKDVSALLILLIFFLIIIFHALFSGKLRRQYNTLLDESGKLYGFRGFYLWNRQDYKNGIDIRLFHAQKLIIDYCKNEEKTERGAIRMLTTNVCKSGLSNGLSNGLFQTIAYLFVVLRAAAGALTVGSIVKYASIIYRFSSAISDVCSQFSYFAVSSQRQQATMEYIKFPDVLPKGTIPVEKRAFCDDGDNEYEFELRNVSFKYPGSEKWALRNVSLKFRIGERLAIVGMNGSGKTTMIKLLCRLYDPTEGTILLNGVDIRKYDYKEYISLFSVVFQDFKLFAFNLGQNVAASAQYDKQRVLDCLEKAGFGDRLKTLPDKDETYLYKGFDEQGVEISGGEAQKIALARALYKNAPFIILDEPTAALDPIAEYDIYTRFNELVENKTAVYISHRLSSCRFCDNIAVFHEGELIQQGSHEVLLADTHNKYYELWTAQAQYYE